MGAIGDPQRGLMGEEGRGVDEDGFLKGRVKPFKNITFG